MSEKYFSKIGKHLIAMVVLLELGHLSWEHLNGGVLSHHLLNRSDFPSISNWWGIIILPLLAWFSRARIKRRITFLPDADSSAPNMPTGIVIGFFGMLIASILQSVAFKFGYQDITMYMALGILVTGLLLPIYRVECILGNVLGAVLTFGPVIPLIGMLVMGSISAFSNLGLKPLILRVAGMKLGSNRN
jgi:hypothetical protein